MTVLYSILHLLVDGLCAIAMFGRYIPQKDGYFYILLYNFCAFALQMPFGVLLDALNLREKKGKAGKTDFAFLTVTAGVLCTVAGAVIHPVLLGIGNALFHVGGGVGSIREDQAGHRRGRGLGLFVAPGALGLYLGNLIAVRNPFGVREHGAGEVLLAAIAGTADISSALRQFLQGWNLWYLCVSAIMLLLLYMGIRCLRRSHIEGVGEKLSGNASGAECSLSPGGGAVRLMFCCLMVVVLRSYIGMAVAFPWKTGTLAGLLSVLALAGGKAAGGFLGAWKGTFRTAVVSLTAAAFCYFFSFLMPMGLAALFLFNMTMPITLYWMILAFPQMPGSAFGFLTFALFLGFLPGYFGMQPLWSGNVLGCMGSVLSLLLLAAGLGKGSRGEKLSD